MRRIVGLALGTLFVTGCVTGQETLEADDHGVEFTLAGDELRATFTLQSGWYVSPEVAVPQGASRVAAMLTLTEVPLDVQRRFQARAVNDDGTTGEWTPLEVTFTEEELRVIRADLPGGITGGVQLRVPEEHADFIRLLTWSAGIPEEESDAADDESIRIARSEEEQGLDAALQNAGVLPRSAWGARPPRCSGSDPTKRRMAIHHTAGAPTSGGSYEAALRQIQAYHMDGRGYCDAGYHFAVTLDGRTWELRPLNFFGAHSGNYNTGNAGIVMVGCFDSAACANVSGPRVPSNEMVHGVARVVKALSQKFGIAINADNVKGHGQQPYQQTGCPGDGGRAKLEEIRTLARGGSSSPPPATPPPPTGGECAQVRVNTSGGALNIRPTASTAGAAVGSLADGATVNRVDSVQGQSVNGDRTWHRIRRGDGVTGYIAGAYSRCVAGSTAAPAPSPSPSPAASNPPAGCTFMGPGNSLAAGQAVSSCNGRYSLVHQGDGNVVLYNTSTGRAAWATGTNGRSTGLFVMQGDGNAVLYAGSGGALWNSGTNGNPGATLAVQDDGNTVIYAPGNRAIWSTGTVGR